jgi:toxin-antitoxin system PIN domain toxin
VKTISLLDVNVLIATAWPTHPAHGKAQQWLANHALEGWATCPLTELAFVRILSNPAFSPHALRPNDALALLRANLAHPAHQFWSDEIPLGTALEPLGTTLTGHQQLTDAYLLGLAILRKGRLVTLDQTVARLLSNKTEQQHFVVVI